MTSRGKFQRMESRSLQPAAIEASSSFRLERFSLRSRRRLMSFTTTRMSKTALEILNSALSIAWLVSNIQHKDFAISVATGVSVPTGSYQNGQHSGTLTPTVLGEKGWGPFNVQSTIGIQIPASDTYLTGQPYTFNTAFQYRLGKMLWPELEVNATGYKGGPSDGKKQTFLTPGLFVGRIPVNRNMGLTFGVGMQIAATRYHTYDHSLLFSVRLPLEARRER